MEGILLLRFILYEETGKNVTVCSAEVIFYAFKT